MARAQPRAPAKGRRPKPSYEGSQVSRQVLVSANSGYRAGVFPANLVTGGICGPYRTSPPQLSLRGVSEAFTIYEIRERQPAAAAA